MCTGRSKRTFNAVSYTHLKIKCICEKYNQPMPTQFKLVYDVSKNSLDTHYEYENQYSDDPYKSSWDVAEEWFEQVKAQEEGSAQ